MRQPEALNESKIYDCPNLGVRTQMQSRVIYTWNTKHFLRIAPDMHGRFKRPKHYAASSSGSTVSLPLVFFAIR